MLKVFGCDSLLRPYNRNKFYFCNSKCVLLGPSAAHIGYLCLHHIGKVYIARHITFNEESFPFENDPNFKQSVTLRTQEYTQLLSLFHSHSTIVEINLSSENSVDDTLPVDTQAAVEDSPQEPNESASHSHSISISPGFDLELSHTQTL